MLISQYQSQKRANKSNVIFNRPFAFLLSFLICLALIQNQIQCRSVGIMEITFNNLKNVLNTYHEIHVLFHNPQCQHSIRYSEQFLKIRQSTAKKSSISNNQQGQNQQNDQFDQGQAEYHQQKHNQHDINSEQNFNKQQEDDIKFGIVDCLRQIQLCQQFNLLHFPALAKINKQLQKSQFIDEQQFLVDFGIQTPDSDNYILNKFISYLKDQEGYAVAVLEEQGLPVQNRFNIKKSNQNQNDLKISERVFYLQPSTAQRKSNFSNTLLSFVDQRTGCWIFSNKNRQKLQKFYCNDGHNPEQIKQYVNLFKSSNNSVKKVVFSQAPPQKSSSSMQKMSINAQILYEVLEKYESQTCRLVYFFSNSCKFCSSKDIKRIKSVLTKMNILNNPFVLNLYDVDKNQIPSSLLGISKTKNNRPQNKNVREAISMDKFQQKSQIHIKRVPEMLYICKGKLKLFGQIFFEQKIEQFININFYGKKYNEEIEIEQEKVDFPQEKILIDRNQEAMIEKQNNRKQEF